MIVNDELIMKRLANMAEDLTKLKFKDLKKNYTYAENLFQHGNLMMMIKNYGYAIDRYTEALKRHPSDPVYWRNRAVAFEADGQDDEAKMDREVAKILECEFIVFHGYEVAMKSNHP